MTSPARARIEPAAIRDNVALLDARSGHAAVLAAVKADGYGHGLVPAARAALEGGATWLGVAQLREALALRSAGIEARIIAWLGTPGEPYADAVRADVDLGASAPWAVREIAAAARAAGRPARVHLEADTGMSRGGAPAEAWAALVDAALAEQAAGHLTVVGLFSHFACADIPGHPSIEAQLTAFRDAIEHAEKAGVHPEVRHMANSAATLTLPRAHFDLVRPGIACYGLTPIPEAGTFGLRPAMTLTARLALAKRVPPGSGVSYGHRYFTPAETTLAVVPVGYADGVPRAAGPAGVEVLAAGRRRAIAGTVCMDQFVLDLGDDPAAAGDEVLLFGPGDHGEPTATDWARALGTISYEIVTRLGARIPRTYEPAAGP